MDFDELDALMRGDDDAEGGGAELLSGSGYHVVSARSGNDPHVGGPRGGLTRGVGEISSFRAEDLRAAQAQVDELEAGMTAAYRNRDSVILAAKVAGMTIAAVAAVLGVGPRKVDKALARARTA